MNIVRLKGLLDLLLNFQALLFVLVALPIIFLREWFESDFKTVFNQMLDVFTDIFEDMTEDIVKIIYGVE